MSDEKKLKKKAEALDVLFPVAESQPESQTAFIVDTVDGRTATSVVEESISILKTGEDLSVPKADVTDPGEENGEEDQTPEPVETHDKNPQEPTMAEVCEIFADKIGEKCEAANKRKNDGNPGVNLHGTRIMNRTRSLQNELRNFAKFLRQEQIDG